MAKPLKILYATSELAPLVNTGGLAEVAATLPRVLRARGHDVRVVMPCFQSVPENQRGEAHCLCVADLGGGRVHGQLRRGTVDGTDIPLYLIEHDGYYGRSKLYGEGAQEYTDNAERFCFFSQAVLHGIPQTQWRPDVVHCHDWHTAAIPTLLHTRFKSTPAWEGMPTVFTIHNLAFQGRYRADKMIAAGLDAELFHPDYLEYEGDMNLMKGAIRFAGKLTTVSPRYAQEIQTLEYGCGLDGVLRNRRDDLSGILNGVDYDVWNPATDPHLPAKFSAKDLRGKAVCKEALQEVFGLPRRAVPLVGIVSRLFWQKGLDLVVEALDQIGELDIQVVVLGTGDPEIEERLTDAAQRHPSKLGVALKYDQGMAHRVQAGSDFFLMPSRYEPCGLGQLYSMAYGTIPIVRRTGGLADSVRNLDPVSRRRGGACGIVFVPLTPESLLRSFQRAVSLYESPETLAQVRANAMAQDFSWDRSCREYERVYAEAIDLP